ncbi:MAG: hypothetical protein ACU0BS_01955 [Hasllibacter sp.]
MIRPAPAPVAAPAAALLAAALAAAPAAAQRIITPDAFLDAAEGRTLTFVLDDTDALVGTERFLSRTRSVWARADGTCSYGDLTVEGAALCFVYEDSAQSKWCWWPIRRGDDLLVRSTDADHQTQRVAAITRDPVGCEGEPLS